MRVLFASRLWRTNTRCGQRRRAMKPAIAERTPVGKHKISASSTWAPARLPLRYTTAGEPTSVDRAPSPSSPKGSAAIICSI